MRLLTDEARSLAGAHALLAKDLDERANTPLKMSPVGEHWHSGPKRMAGKTRINLEKEGML